MKVKDFAKMMLEIEDQDAEVLVIEHSSSYHQYEQGGTASEVSFNKEVHVEYTDFRGSPHVKEDTSYYNKRYFLIGAKDT